MLPLRQTHEKVPFRFPPRSGSLNLEVAFKITIIGGRVHVRTRGASNSKHVYERATHAGCLGRRVVAASALAGASLPRPNAARRACRAKVADEGWTASPHLASRLSLRDLHGYYEAPAGEGLPARARKQGTACGKSVKPAEGPREAFTRFLRPGSWAQACRRSSRQSSRQSFS